MRAFATLSWLGWLAASRAAFAQTSSASGSAVAAAATGEIQNCIPIVQGWDYTVRLFRPHAEILNGMWKFPEATPVGSFGVVAKQGHRVGGKSCEM